MIDTWVLNASPLIALTNIGRTEILTGHGREVVVPPAVVAEFQRGGADRLPELIRVLDPVTLVSTVLMWGLGDGETEVLSYALGRPGVVAIIDDLAARRCARAHGVRSRGTIGLVVLARQQGVIPAAGPVLSALRQAGFYVSAAVLAAARAAAGEPPEE